MSSEQLIGAVGGSPTAAAAVTGRTGAARRGTPRRALTLGLTALALLVAAFASLAVGSKTTSPADVFAALRGSRAGDAVIVADLRIPRTALGLLVGVALGLAGAVAQGVTRNPLADPGLLGVGAGAAFAVAAGISFLGLAGPLEYVWPAFAGGAVAGGLVYVVGGTGRSSLTPARLALAGAAVTALLDAVTHALVLLDVSTLDRYRLWAVGSLAGRDPSAAWRILPFVVVGAVGAVALSGKLDALALGDDTAAALGARVALVRLGGAAVVVVLTGAAVAVAGPVTFVGLVVPHIVKAAVGAEARWVVPVSGAVGGVLVLVADTVGRVVARPGEVEVGVVTALIGAPFLIGLVRRSKRVAG